MKNYLAAIFIFLVTPAWIFGNPVDTTIRGIPVQFHYSEYIFPDNWRSSPVNACGEEITASEVRRSEKIVISALNKYPKETLEQNLKNVYFLKSMKFFNVGYGGTNSIDALYITNNGEFNGYSDFYMEQTFHHEFSSILIRNYPSLLDTIAWKKANAEGFDYNDPENGVGAIRNHQSSQKLDSEFCNKGMLTQYAMSSLENDANTIAQNLFCPASNFWSLVDHYPMVKTKVLLLIQFYHRLNSMFTESYFRKLGEN